MEGREGGRKDRRKKGTLGSGKLLYMLMLRQCLENHISGSHRHYLNWEGGLQNDTEFHLSPHLISRAVPSLCTTVQICQFFYQGNAELVSPLLGTTLKVGRKVGRGSCASWRCWAAEARVRVIKCYGQDWLHLGYRDLA